VRVMRARSATSSSCSCHQHCDLGSYSGWMSLCAISRRDNTYMCKNQLDEVQRQLLCLRRVWVRSRGAREPRVYRRGDGAWTEAERSSSSWCCIRWGAAGSRRVWHRHSQRRDTCNKEDTKRCYIVGFLSILWDRSAHSRDMSKSYAGWLRTCSIGVCHDSSSEWHLLPILRPPLPGSAVLVRL
jgi:hypothetical protein